MAAHTYGGLVNRHDNETNREVFTPKIVKPPKGFEEKFVENYFEKDTGGFDRNGKPVYIKVGRKKADIYDQWMLMTDGWPKKYGDSLFYEADDGKVVVIKKPSQLFAFLGVKSTSHKWAQGNDKSTKDEFLEYLSQSQEIDTFAALSKIPTWPTLEKTYYLKQAEATEPKGVLDEIVNMFSPATDVDRLLIKAFFCTPFWGGSPGSKPLFTIDAKSDDSEGGRGVGKTVLVETLAKLTDAPSIDLSPNDNQFEIARRLLSSTDQKVVRWDNVKSNKFSHSGVESLITTQYVSGHKMHQGLTQVANHFTFCVTMNGACLSKDLAKRSIRIELGRPVYTSDWMERMDNLIEKNRASIYGDIKEILTRSVDQTYQPKTRFGRWEKEVAVRICGPLIGEHIVRKQSSMDFDAGENDLMEDRICLYLSELKMTDNKPYEDNGIMKVSYQVCDPERHNFVIPSSDVYDLYRKVTGLRHCSDLAAMNAINRSPINRLTKGENKVRGVGRHFLWTPNPDNSVYYKITSGKKIISLKNDVYRPQKQLLIDNEANED